MAEELQPLNRRMCVGVLSLLSLLVAASSFAYLGPEVGSKNVLVGVTVRLGLVLGAIWLAWPQVNQLNRYMPKIVVWGALIALGVAVLRPRLVPLTLLFLVVAIGLQLTLRYFASRAK